MDGYSHHDHKKRDLQVSKGDSWSMQREWEESKMEARGVDKENTIVKNVICVHVYLVHVICE
jgi:hypothetical protein